MEKRTCGIFTLQGIRAESQIKIVHELNEELAPSEIIQDSLIERYDIIKEVCGEIYRCNITDAFLAQSKKLPMFYVNVVLERPLRRILLFKILLNFTITTVVKNSKQLLDENLDGEFSLELHIDNKNIKLDDHMTRYIGDKKYYEKMKLFTAQDSINEIIKDMIQEIDAKLRAEYKNEFEKITVPQNIISLRDLKLD